MLIWALEALVETLPKEQAKAWAWTLDGKAALAEAKAASDSATETEIGAIALTKTFLDDLRATLTG